LFKQIFKSDGLRQIFDHFSSKFQNFLEKISKFPKSEKNSKRTLLKTNKEDKLKPSSIFTKNLKVFLIFFTPEFALEISKFQN
jgi:uncharacterized protein YeaO (DUF488 family)